MELHEPFARSVDWRHLNHIYSDAPVASALPARHVRLTRKLAAVVDGIDLSRCQVGDVIELTDHEARLLIAEGWAEEAK